MMQGQDRIGSTLARTRRLTTRIAPRHRVELPAELRERGRGKITVRVHDLSAHGFRSDSLYRLAADTLVWIRLPGLAPIAARVRWFGANHIGCAFETPLHSAICAALVDRHAVDEARQTHGMLHCGKSVADLSHA